MKQLKFETSKGKFIIKELKYISLDSEGISLKEITEEQSIDIVEFEDGDRMLYGYAKNKLHSLLKSKGIHLYENPYKGHENKDFEWLNEEITFYNPFIFKL